MKTFIKSQTQEGEICIVKIEKAWAKKKQVIDTVRFIKDEDRRDMLKQNEMKRMWS